MVLENNYYGVIYQTFTDTLNIIHYLRLKIPTVFRNMGGLQGLFPKGLSEVGCPSSFHPKTEIVPFSPFSETL
jgi:hypothetical protein